MMNTKLLSSLVAAFVVATVGCGSDEPAPSGTQDTGVAETGGDTGGDTGGGDTGGGDTGGGETSGETGAPVTCDEYCNTVSANCTGDKNSQYIDKATCMSMCAKMALGTRGATDGDTVACRLYHSEAAKTLGADTHCPHAGAYGGGVCGTRCDAFCKLAVANCTGTAGFNFTDEADCKTKCGAMSFDATKAEIDATAKTKLNCVQYHLQAAYTAKSPHCSHLSTTSGPCGP